jgi:hypothetical protein
VFAKELDMAGNRLWYGMNLDECIRFADRHGIQRVTPRRTGELRFESWSDRRPMTVNGRRKDAPRELVRWLMQELRIIQAAKEEQATGSVAAICTARGERLPLYLSFRDGYDPNACVTKDSQ